MPDLIPPPSAFPRVGSSDLCILYIYLTEHTPWVLAFFWESEDRSQVVWLDCLSPRPFPSSGKKFPIEAVSDLVALFWYHQADISFRTPAEAHQLLVPAEGNPALRPALSLSVALHPP